MQKAKKKCIKKQKMKRKNENPHKMGIFCIFQILQNIYFVEL